MVLSARLLTNVCDVNGFDFAQRFEMTEGDQTTLYIQLIDATKHKDLVPSGLRYIPANGATLTLTLDSLDNAKRVTRSATQPFTDPSIWAVCILSSDKILGTVNLKLTLTENSVVKSGTLLAAISVFPKDY